MAQHNMLEEGILEHRAFRKTLAELSFAEVWVTPAADQVFDFNSGAGKVFDEMFDELAAISGYAELAFAPVVPIGHSAAASYPWNYAAFNPGRTLAVLSIHGDAPLTNRTGSGKPNPDWGGKNIDGIPGLIVIGEYEWWEERLLPAMEFQKKFPNSTIALLADAGHGHFDYSDELVDFLAMFIRKAAQARLPAVMAKMTAATLKKIDHTKGWLVDRWRPNQPLQAQAAPWHHYQANREEAFWTFDRQMAEATERYYSRARAKTPQYIGYVQHGRLLPGAGSFLGYKPLFIPDGDGLTFHVSAAFTDTLQGKQMTKNHAAGKISITRICGPVTKINDTTFKIQFYRMGLNNPKRTGDIWLMASHTGDDQYKSSVQQANLKIPLRNTIGREQAIKFPAISNQKIGAKVIKLRASSTSGEPVQFYIKDGPAEVEGNILKFTKIPKRAKFPLKVTIVAWQWGRSVDPKLQSAEPVEQSFLIVK